MAENKLSLNQLKQIKEVLEIADDRCPRDNVLQDAVSMGGYCDRDCLYCWSKAVENELEKRGAGE